MASMSGGGRDHRDVPRKRTLFMGKPCRFEGGQEMANGKSQEGWAWTVRLSSFLSGRSYSSSSFSLFQAYLQGPLRSHKEGNRLTPLASTKLHGTTGQEAVARESLKRRGADLRQVESHPKSLLISAQLSHPQFHASLLWLQCSSSPCGLPAKQSLSL